MLNGAVAAAALNAVTRSANANYVIPTENEWYKAAYYNPASSSYYLYPTKSNSQPSNVLLATGTNNANYYNSGYTDPTNYLTAVGAFAASPLPFGTYDRGGDVFQWNESVYSGSYRGLRGGSFDNNNDNLQSGNNDNPTDENNNIGLRVSQAPELQVATICGQICIDVTAHAAEPCSGTTRLSCKPRARRAGKE